MHPSDFIAHKADRLRFRLGKRPKFNNDQFETSRRDIAPDEASKSDLHRLFYGNIGPLVHKWTHYLGVYDRFLSPFRGKSVKLLEIGVSKGGSLKLWRDYLGRDAVIFGIDIDPSCAQHDGNYGQVRIGSQADPHFLRRVVAEMGGVDVVIDDGSHVASHQIASFECLFPLLASPSTYICEDLHTSYWRGLMEGGYRRSSTFIELAKRGVDDIHADFHGRGQTIPEAHRLISAIHFYPCMVVIEKVRQGKPVHVQIG